MESGSACVDNVTLVIEIVQQAALEANPTWTQIPNTAAWNSFSNVQDCTGVFAALQGMQAADNTLTDLNLNAAPDCFTALPNGRTIADACAVYCGTITSFATGCDPTSVYTNATSGSPTTILGTAYAQVDAYYCNCLPGWGDHNCDRWLISDGTSVVAPGLGGHAPVVAGEEFSREVQATNAAGVPITTELALNNSRTADPSELFDISSNDMVINSTRVVYTGQGKYELFINITQSGPQLVFIWTNLGGAAVSLSGSPFQVQVLPAATFMPNAEFLGPGASTARHGRDCGANLDAHHECYVGNDLIIRLRDLYNNPRPENADAFGINASGVTHTNDFSTSAVTASAKGQYSLKYWWQQANYDQDLTICHLGTTAGPNGATFDSSINACTNVPDFQIRHLQVYVIPAQFWVNNDYDVFEPVTSTVSGTAHIVAGEQVVLNLTVKDEFGTLLARKVNLSGAQLDHMSQYSPPRNCAEDSSTVTNCLFEFHAPNAGERDSTWVIAYVGNGIYQARSTFYDSQCDNCSTYPVHVLGQEMSGLGFIALSGSPFRLTVSPAPIDLSTSFCVGHGCDIARHGTQTSFEGNPMVFNALDRYDNARPVGADPMTMNFLSSSAKVNVVVLPNGVYNITYWWEIATYEQLILICPNATATDGNDIDSYADWTLSTEACGVNATMICPESPSGLISAINSDQSGDFANITGLTDTTCLSAISTLMARPDMDIVCDATVGVGSNLLPVRSFCPQACGSCTNTRRIPQFKALADFSLEVYVVPEFFHVYQASNQFDAGQSQVHPPRDSSNVTVGKGALSTLVAGEQYNVTINALTSRGEPLSDVLPGNLNEVFYVSADDIVSYFVTYSGNGVYTATMNITHVGYTDTCATIGGVGTCLLPKSAFIMSSFGTDPVRPESTLLENAPWFVIVTPAALDAKESFLSGPGVVMAQDGERGLDVEGGNILYVHARDRFGNPRTDGSDQFAIDPLYASTFSGTVEYIGGTLEQCQYPDTAFDPRCEGPFAICDLLVPPGSNGVVPPGGAPCLDNGGASGMEGKSDRATYLIRFWWLAQYAQGYEVCIRKSSLIAGFGACGSATNPMGFRDQVVEFKQIFMRPNEGNPWTEASFSLCICGNAFDDPTACSLMTGTAGVQSSFTIEAKNNFEFPNYRGNDFYELELEGPLGTDVKVVFSYVRINFYEVRYTPIIAGNYNLDICLCKTGATCGCMNQTKVSLIEGGVRNGSSVPRTPLGMYGPDCAPMPASTTGMWNAECMTQFCTDPAGTFGKYIDGYEWKLAKMTNPRQFLGHPVANPDQRPDQWTHTVSGDMSRLQESPPLDYFSPIVVSPNVPSAVTTAMTTASVFTAGQLYRVSVSVKDIYNNPRTITAGDTEVKLVLTDGTRCDSTAVPVSCNIFQIATTPCACTADLASSGGSLGDYHVDVTRWLAGQYTVSTTIRNASTASITYEHAVGSPVTATLAPGSLNVTNTRLLNLAAPATPGAVAWQLNGTVAGRAGANFWGVEDTWTRIPQTVTLNVAAGMVLQFQAVDAFFNPVPGNDPSPTSTDQDFTVSVSFTGALGTTQPMTTLAGSTGQVIGGRYTYGFSPTNAGTYDVQYTISLTNVASATVQETIGPYRVTFVPEAAAVAQSTKTGSGLISATAGVYGSFSIILNDQFGNERISTDTVEVVMAPWLIPNEKMVTSNVTFSTVSTNPHPGVTAPPVGTATHGWIENQRSQAGVTLPGRYTVHYYVEDAILWEVTTSINDQVMGLPDPVLCRYAGLSSPAVYNASTPYGFETVVLNNGKMEARTVAGVVAKFSVQSMDAFGNKRFVDDASISVVVKNRLTSAVYTPQSIFVEQKRTSGTRPQDTGRYEISLQIEAANAYFIEIYAGTTACTAASSLCFGAVHDDIYLNNDGVRYVVQPGTAYGQNCEAQPQSGQTAGTPNQFAIRLFDRYDNRNFGTNSDGSTQLSFTVTLTPHAAGSPTYVANSIVWNNATHQYDIAIMAEKSGNYDLQITMDLAVPETIPMGAKTSPIPRVGILLVRVHASTTSVAHSTISGIGVVRTEPWRTDTDLTNCLPAGRLHEADDPFFTQPDNCPVTSSFVVTLRDRFSNNIPVADLPALQPYFTVSLNGYPTLWQCNASTLASTDPRFASCTTGTLGQVMGGARFDNPTANPPYYYLNDSIPSLCDFGTPGPNQAGTTQWTNASGSQWFMRTVVGSVDGEIEVQYRLAYSLNPVEANPSLEVDECADPSDVANCNVLGAVCQADDPANGGEIVNYADPQRAFLLSIDWCNPMLGTEGCGLVGNTPGQIAADNPYRIKVGVYVPPSHRPYLVTERGLVAPPLPDPVIVMANMDKTVWFQNVYRSGAPMCGTCICSDPFDLLTCTPTGCTPCTELIDLNDQLQIETGFGAPVFAAQAYERSSYVTLSADPTEPDVDSMTQVNFAQTEPWFTIVNTNPAAWGRYSCKLSIRTAGNFFVRLTLDAEPFAAFNVSIRPELAAASVTQVINSAVQMPGSVADFDANTTTGAAALNQFASGIADLFGVDPDEIVIIDVSNNAIGRRLTEGNSGAAVTIHYRLQLVTTESAAQMINTTVNRPGFSNFVSTKLVDDDASASTPLLGVNDTTATGVAVRELHPAVAGATSTFKVRLADHFGNAQASGHETFAIDGQDVEFVSTQVDSATLDYIVTYATLACPEGHVEFELSMNGLPVRKMPYVVGCASGPIHAPASIATMRTRAKSVKESANMVAGQTESIHIATYDVHGTKKTTGGDLSRFVVRVTDMSDLSNCGSCNSKVTDLGDGTVIVTYTIVQTGKFSVSVGVKNTNAVELPIKFSPFVSTVTTGNVHPAACGVTSKHTHAAVGQWTDINIIPFDAYGNKIPETSHLLEMEFQGGAGFSVRSSGLEQRNDPATPLVLSVRSIIAGTQTIQVQYRNADGAMSPAGHPVTLTYFPGAATLSKSTITAGRDNASKCVVGVESAITIQPRDAHGNAAVVNTDAMIVTLQLCASNPLSACTSTSGPLTEGSVVSHDGMLTILYTAPTTGYYQLRFVHGGNDVRMADFTSPTVVISDIKTVATTCVATGSGLTSAASGAAANFTIQANGLYHGTINSRYSDGDAFEVSIMAGALLLKSKQEYIGDGKYLVEYTAMSSGHAEPSWDVILSVSLAGAEIYGSPFVLQMHAGEAVAANSVATGMGASSTVAGSLTTFQVMTSDTNNNIIASCDEYTTSTTLAFNKMLTVPKFVDCHDGIYNYQYSVGYVGTYELNVEYDGVKSNASPYLVTIRATGISASDTFIASDAAGHLRGLMQTTAGDDTSLYIHTRDRFGNVLTAPICPDSTTDCVRVEFRLCQHGTESLDTVDTASCAARQPTATPSTIQSNGNGIYVVNATISQSGTYMVTASMNQADGTVDLMTHNAISVYVSAPKRTYTISSTCTGDACLCKPGYEKDDESSAELSCVLCSPGTYKEGYSNVNRCTACPNTTSTVSDIAVSVEACRCEAGTYNFRHTYIRCVDDNWSPAMLKLDPLLYESAKAGMQCIPCPACAVCPGDGTIQVREGFWSFPRDESYRPYTYFEHWANDSLKSLDTINVAITAYKCAGSDGDGSRCAGGMLSDDDPNAGCAEGAEGPTCASCKIGYTMTAEGCQSCETVHQQSTINMDVQDILLVTSLALFAGFLGFVMVKQAKAEDVLKLKILIGFGQVVQSFSSTYNVQWPANLRTFINMFTVFNFDIFSIANAECSMLWSRSFVGRFVATVSMPVALVGLIGILWKLQLAKSRRRRVKAGATSPLEQKIADIEISGQWASRAFFILVLTYLHVSSTIMDVFKCRYFEPTANGDNARIMLEADLSVRCDDNAYLVLKLVAIVGTFLYPIGVPVFFVLLLWRERKHLHDSVNQKKYGFLFGDYVAVYFLWEVWDLGRKLMLSGLLIFFKRGSVSQLLVAMVIALFALELQLRVMPYKSFMANIIQVAAFNAILLNLVGAMLLKVDDSAMVNGLGVSFADGFLVLINLTVPILVLFALVFSMGHDLYLYSVGRFVKTAMMTRSRQAVMQALLRSRQSAAGEHESVGLPNDDLGDEASLVNRLQAESERVTDRLQQARQSLEQKREWYRFVRNHTNTSDEFKAMVESESMQSYRRLLGLSIEEQAEMTDIANPIASIESTGPRDASACDVERPNKTRN
jgi:hypothetical protein